MCRLKAQSTRELANAYATLTKPPMTTPVANGKSIERPEGTQNAEVTENSDAVESEPAV